MPTLTNLQLHHLVKPIIPFASKEDYGMPVLNAIHFMPDEADILTAYATDRYRVGRMKLAKLKAEGFTATLSIRAVRFLLATFKRNNKEGSLTLTHEPAGKDGAPGTVRISGESGDVWGKVELAISEASSSPYPKVESLFPAAGELPRAEESFTGAYLSDMGAVTAGSRLPMTVEMNMTPGKPALFRHEDESGAQFTGLLMPQRLAPKERDQDV